MARLFFLFYYMVLPAANAVLDWLSLSFSRMLAGRIAGRHGGWGMVTWHMLADLVAAVILLLGLIVTAIVSIEWLNHHARDSFGEEVLPLEAFITTTAADPLAPGGWWASFMLFSTLIPTAAHFFLLCGYLIARGFPQSFRDDLATKLERGRERKDWSCPCWFLAAQPALAAIMVLLLGVLVWRLGTALPGLISWLPEFALGVLEWAQGMYGGMYSFTEVARPSSGLAVFR